MPQHVLLLQVGDSKRVAVIAALKHHECTVLAVANRDDLLQRLATARVDLVLLNLAQVGDAVYVALCRQVRALTMAPLLIFADTAPDQEVARALHAGADLFIIGAPSVNVLVAHVEAYLRRMEISHAPYAHGPDNRRFVTADGRLQLDLAARSIHLDGAAIALTRTEFSVLAALARRAGQVVAYDQIIHEVWGWDRGDRGSVHTCVAAIRRKLGDDTEQPRYLVNEFGIGYRFCKLEIRQP